MFEYIANQMSTNQFFSGAVAASVVASLIITLKNLPRQLYSWCKRVMTVEIYVTDSYRHFDLLQTWLVSQEGFADPKRVSLEVNSRSKPPTPKSVGSRRFRSLADIVGKSLDPSSSAQDHIRHAPGIYFGVLKRRFCWLNVKKERNEDGGWTSSFSLVTFAFSKNFVHEVLKDFFDSHPEIDNSKSIEIYFSGDHGFNSKTIPLRPASTVFLNNGILDTLLSDAFDFVERRDFYLTHGIPHKRCYLLYGQPGTGKSTIGKVLATELSRDVYVLSTNIPDGSFSWRWSEIEDGSIIVLEDIDSQGSDLDRKASTNNTSLSTLLNCIDGPMAKDNCIIVLTTNCPESLDPALTRAGRVDMALELKYLDRDSAREMAQSFLGEVAGTAFVEGLDLPISPAVLQEALMMRVEAGLKEKAGFSGLMIYD